MVPVGNAPVGNAPVGNTPVGNTPVGKWLMCVPKGTGICPGGGGGEWATLVVARMERHMTVIRLVEGMVASVFVFVVSF
jgi:hypothetical protein